MQNQANIYSENLIAANTNLSGRMRLAALNGAVGSALVAKDNLKNTLNRCAEILVENLEVPFARIGTLDEAESILELQASAGIYTHLDRAHSRAPVGKFKIGLIAEERQPHFTNEVLSDSRVSGKKWAKREKMKPFAGYLLIVEDRLVGVMCVFARHALTDETLQAMAWVSDGIAILIERIGMPDEDGYSLIQKVRMLPVARGSKIPAVALTAYAGAADRIRALRAGFQMHISKPVEAAELHENETQAVNSPAPSDATET